MEIVFIKIKILLFGSEWLKIKPGVYCKWFRKMKHALNNMVQKYAFVFATLFYGDFSLNHTSTVWQKDKHLLKRNEKQHEAGKGTVGAKWNIVRMRTTQPRSALWWREAWDNTYHFTRCTVTSVSFAQREYTVNKMNLSWTNPNENGALKRRRVKLTYKAVLNMILYIFKKKKRL